MAGLGKIDIILDFDEIVKIRCCNTRCKFNLMNSAASPDNKTLLCDLKHIEINNYGVCETAEYDEEAEYGEVTNTK